MIDIQPTGLEATVEYIKRRFHANRTALFWIALWVLLLWVMIQVKEVTSLLALSYVLVLLLDPFVTRLEKRGIPRGITLGAIFVFLFLAFLALIAFAVPALLTEYSSLVDSFPIYVRSFAEKLQDLLSQWPTLQAKLNPDALWDDVQHYSSMIELEHVKRVVGTLGDTLLSGYSVTLTILNLTLLPFFVYYIGCDLRQIHRFCGRLLSPRMREEASETGQEILAHMYVFFRGQFTVACILMLFYTFGLLLIGLPSAFIIGILSGALSVIPYLGVTTGIAISLLITMVTSPGWWPVIKVVIVFMTVQTIEGTILTPRIIGEKLGIHPLGVMLALIVGGKLLGLLGLIIAIPAAASCRVLVRRVLTDLKRSSEGEAEHVILA